MLLDGTRPWLDPAATSLNRLPVRPSMVPCPDLVTARRHDPSASPWWRSLDGEWEFTLLGRPEELTPAHLTGADLGGHAEVPGAWTLQGHPGPSYTNVAMPFAGEPPSVPGENPTAAYRRTVDVPAEWQGRRTVLRIGAAESMAFVYIDGAPVGWTTDSRLPAEFDLTGHVRAGGTHVLAVVVPRWSAATWLEDQDQWWHGGLQRSVSLHSTAPAWVASAKLVGGLAGPLTGPVGAGELRDGTLSVDVAVGGRARTEAGWTVEVRVETLRRSPVATTGALAVPHWDGEDVLTQMVGAMATDPGRAVSELEVPRVHPWSAESPRCTGRFWCCGTPGAPSSRSTPSRSASAGWRSATGSSWSTGPRWCCGGSTCTSTTPGGGGRSPGSTPGRDLLMARAANLNAVRASHYPHDEHFAELCDELGLYLVDEANVESHGRQASLCHDRRYHAATVQRVERMAARDVHHPSIVVWSLGNEAGYGPAHDEAAAYLRRWDPSRPVQYEPPVMVDLCAEAPVTDVVCPMYRSVGEIVEWAERAADARRPLILCEYSHAMGNACGSLVDYDDAFESHGGLQGGFIWEWVSHGIPLAPPYAAGMDPSAPVPTGPDGGVNWGYGGDFGDDPAEGHFVLDGLVDADRHPHPTLDEVRHMGRPVRAELVAHTDRSATVAVVNQRWFTDTSDLVGEWELVADGEVVAGTALDGRPIPGAVLGPRGRATVSLRWPVGHLVAGAEHHLSVRWRQAGRTAWAPKGAVVATEQFRLPRADARRPRPARRADDGFRSRPRPEGFPGSWVPTVFRALTDNDGIRRGWMRGLNGSLHRWIDLQGLDACRWDPQAGELHPGADLPPVRVRSAADELGGGWHRLSVTFELPEELADLPRLGVVWELPGDMERLEWFGDGPHECYPDRRAAATVGRWRSTVSAQYEPYGMPQEHGHHTGLRWVTLRGGGRGAAGRRRG